MLVHMAGRVALLLKIGAAGFVKRDFGNFVDRTLKTCTFKTTPLISPLV